MDQGRGGMVGLNEAVRPVQPTLSTRLDSVAERAGGNLGHLVAIMNTLRERLGVPPAPPGPAASNGNKMTPAPGLEGVVALLSDHASATGKELIELEALVGRL